MAPKSYPAIIERAGVGYSVFFPDLPGCTSAGRTVSKAMSNATQALNEHIQISHKSGDDLPPLSHISG